MVKINHINSIIHSDIRISEFVKGVEKGMSTSPKQGLWWRALLTIAVAASGWFIPVPDGLTLNAWYLFSIFLGTVVGFILQPIELGTIALIALVACAHSVTAASSSLIRSASQK